MGHNFDHAACGNVLACNRKRLRMSLFDRAQACAERIGICCISRTIWYIAVIALANIEYFIKGDGDNATVPVSKRTRGWRCKDALNARATRIYTHNVFYRPEYRIAALLVLSCNNENIGIVVLQFLGIQEVLDGNPFSARRDIQILTRLRVLITGTVTG